MIRDAVRAEARRWLGVPFLHQGRSAAGVDCAGLVIMVARAMGTIPKNFDVNGYRRVPDGTMLLVCDDVFDEATSIDDADVAVMRFKTEPQHIGIVVPYRHGGQSLIHALQRSKRVVEHRLDLTWRSRIVRLYKWPETPKCRP